MRCGLACGAWRRRKAAPIPPALAVYYVTPARLLSASSGGLGRRSWLWPSPVPTRRRRFSSFRCLRRSFRRRFLSFFRLRFFLRLRLFFSFFLALRLALSPSAPPSSWAPPPSTPLNEETDDDDEDDEDDEEDEEEEDDTESDRVRFCDTARPYTSSTAAVAGNSSLRGISTCPASDLSPPSAAPVRN